MLHMLSAGRQYSFVDEYKVQVPCLQCILFHILNREISCAFGFFSLKFWLGMYGKKWVRVWYSKEYFLSSK